MRTARLGDLALINPTWDKHVSPEQPVSFVGMASMSDELGRTVGEEPRTVSQVRTGYTPFRRGDLLVAKITPCFENGKIGRADITNPIGAGSTEFHVVRPGPELDHGYALHFLRRPYFRAAGEPRMTGSGGQRRVPADYLAKTEMPLPPIDEQRRIAAILDKADELRGKRRQALAHLETLTQSIFHEMFGQFLLGARATVGDTGSVQLGRQRAPKYQSGKHTRPYMRVANVKLNSLDLSDVLEMDFDPKDFESYRLNYGDILLNEGQSTELVGRPAMWRNEISECCFQNTLVRYVANPQIIVPEFALSTFLYYFTRGEFSKISSKTSSIAHLGAARFARMPMPTPPLELQQAFATRVAAVERLKEAHRKHLAQLDTLFASLQHRAFSGEL